ncbi:MAG TPA: NAD(P)/FAD-dependent oxidoreductase, partial [Bryobacteraceae bacterium]|nr:NAD(P)/FAD-dependent oxidoreductase [Bryobacteraceae bacterium]
MTRVVSSQGNPSARYDLIVIGGGIAGGALTVAMARRGASVLMLERSRSYVDRVRGEYLAPWGVGELQKLGLAEIAYEAGAQTLTRFVPRDELVSADDLHDLTSDVSKAVQGVPGALGVGHPELCDALSNAAREAGATVVQGVKSSELIDRSNPKVRVVCDEGSEVALGDYCIGCDGSHGLLRTQLGLLSVKTDSPFAYAGLLIQRPPEWPPNTYGFGTFGEAVVYIIPRDAVSLRIYLGYRKGTIPWTTEVRSAICQLSGLADWSPSSSVVASFAADDTVVHPPGVGRFLLAGDAAGHANSIAGQGLALAIRDINDIIGIIVGDKR